MLNKDPSLMKIDPDRRIVIIKPVFNLTTRKHVKRTYIYMFDILNSKYYCAIIFNLQINIFERFFFLIGASSIQNKLYLENNKHIYN